MSTYRVFAARLASVARHVLARILPTTAGIVRTHVPRLAVRGGSTVVRRGPSLLLRMVGRTWSSHVRAISMGAWTKSNMIHRQQRQRPTLRRIRLPPPNANLVGLFRRSLGRTKESSWNDWPRDYSSYELGNSIAKGCGGAVYEARLKTEKTTAVDYPLVMKVLFNYDYLMGEQGVWRMNEPELVACQDRRVQGCMAWCRPLARPHRNVATVHTAFVDKMPLLPDALRLYPDALSPLQDVPHFTMLLVMPRYSMTLRQYVLQYPTEEEKPRTRDLLFAQLLEAIEYLHTQKCSHRDLKSDNILLEMMTMDEVPRLLVTDFGCSYAPRRGDLRVFYNPGDDLGGNVALRPPEIRSRSRAVDESTETSFLNRPSNSLDFTKADLWAVGTLAHEIYTGFNPFYSMLNSETYSEDPLPPLPSSVSSTIGRLVKSLLRRDPAERPSPNVAATCAMLTLFRTFENLPLLFRELRSSSESRGVVEWLYSLYAVETMMGTGRGLSRVESTLRRAFLARVDIVQIDEAINAFH